MDGPNWITPSVLDGAPDVPDDSIDISDTENESESHYSATESDKDFVVPDDISLEEVDYDPDDAPSLTSDDSEVKAYAH